MRQRRLAAAVAVLGVWGTSMGGATPGMAQDAPDATCPGPRDSFASISQAWLAQTFTAQSSGRLTMATFEAYRDDTSGTGDVVIQINAVDGSGTPTHTALATTTFPDELVSTTDLAPSTIAVAFATPASVTAGDQYALAITREGSGELGVSIKGSDACPGALYWTTSTTGPFFMPGTCTPCDVIFQVFVGPHPEPQTTEPQASKADRTLTLDANKGKVEKGRKVTLTGQIDAPANEAGCEPNQTVELQRKKKIAPDTALSTFETVQSDNSGNFAEKVKVKKTYVYRAVVDETEVCDDETSNTQKVRVQKKKAAQEA